MGKIRPYKPRPSKIKGNQYINCGDYTEVVCISRKYGEYRVKIDNDDVEKAKSHTWSVWKAASGDFYCSAYWVYPTKGSIPMHRYILACKSKLPVDHINFDTLDNRKSNLREVTNAFNNSHRKGAFKNNKLGVRNVMWCDKIKKYKVYVKMTHIGCYETLEEAKEVAKLKRLEILGVDN